MPKKPDDKLEHLKGQAHPAQAGVPAMADLVDLELRTQAATAKACAR